MFGSLYVAIERWARSSTSRQGKLPDHIPLWYIRQLSRAKLVWMLRYIYHNSPAQRDIWHAAGLKLGDIRSADVLQHIPFTTAAELAEHPDSYICVAHDKLIHILTTSSAKGLKKTIYLTAGDFDHQVRTMGTHLRRFPEAGRVAAMFLVHDPTWSVGTVIRRGIAEAGMLGFLSGVHRPVQDHLDLIKEYRINRLITSPTHLSRLTFEAPAGLDLKGLGIRYIHLGTQPWTEEFRSRMEQTWGAKLIDGYGSNECVCAIASECLLQNNLHVSEVDFWMEIIDPATGRVLPDGQDGEVVITTLSRLGMPLVRYRTGDLSHLIPRKARCPCGLPLRKMGRVRGRIDDMLIIGAGHNLYPDEVDRAVFSIPGIIDYQLVVEKDTFKDVMLLTVEANGAQDNLRASLLKELLAVESINTPCNLSGNVVLAPIEIVAPGTLTRGRPKSIRIIDKRTGNSNQEAIL
ncbi:MAG: AMP-binding protein [Actinobacteria bacterium]|nr:AMP-binding protein [Actinomycetota bacterium]